MQNSLYKELSTLKLLTIYLKGLLELNVLNWYGNDILICGENLNFTLLIEGIYSTPAPVAFNFINIASKERKKAR